MTLQSLATVPATVPLPSPVTTGFFDLQSFELMQRVSKMFASSSIVPEAYRSQIEKLDRYGKVKETRDNPRAVANCAVALSMAQRMNADPMMVMQNLHIIEGRPSWSSQWIIAAVNSCGRFSPLHFEIEDKGRRDIEYTETAWDNGERKTRTKTVTVNDQSCLAWATEKATGNRVESPRVSIEIAVKEGWYQRNGSKWQTMPDMMLRYRSAAFFGKLYAPEILMGLSTVEEARDVIDVSRQDDGGYAVTVEPAPKVVDLNARLAAQVETQRQPEPVADLSPAATAPVQEPQAQTPAETAPLINEPLPEWPQKDPVTGRIVDARGCPWLEGAHSDGRSVNADGTWRRKRGADLDWIERVEAGAIAAQQAAANPSAAATLADPAPDAAAPVTLDGVLRGIATAETQDQIDEWCDLARTLDLYPEAERRVAQAANDRWQALSAPLAAG
jgi:hypothetical protein